MGGFLSELRPLLEGVPVARDELAPMTADVRQGAEAVQLRLVKRNPDDRTAPDCGGAAGGD